MCTSSPLRSLRPCWEEGASLGKEAVLADSGREGELTTRVGRVRRLAFLSIPSGVFLLLQTYKPMKFGRIHMVFPQPASR
jgi:hypothetical protein